METMSLKSAYRFAEECGLKSAADDIRKMKIAWELPYKSSVRRGFIIDLFTKNGIYEEFREKHWPFSESKKGESHQRWYLRLKTRYEDFLGKPPLTDGPTLGNEVLNESVNREEFALEGHLRDFLAKNLEHIEPGLKLYSSPDRTGVEFPVDGGKGRIDILAIDRKNQFVVIELKLSQGRNKTLGQLLYYMGWVDKNLTQTPCRGYIIATEISEDLRTAVSRVPGVSLARYRMSFSVEPLPVG
jgi:hypothetical protein